jgi:hypothetical protein
LLATVMFTAVEVVWPPSLSVATAVITSLPSVGV